MYFMLSNPEAFAYGYVSLVKKIILHSCDVHGNTLYEFVFDFCFVHLHLLLIIFFILRAEYVFSKNTKNMELL